MKPTTSIVHILILLWKNTLPFCISNILHLLFYMYFKAKEKGKQKDGKQKKQQILILIQDITQPPFKANH